MDIQGMTSASIAMEYSTNVLKKANGMVKQQGEAALQLINSASSVANASGANAGGNMSVDSKGSQLNVVA